MDIGLTVRKAKMESLKGAEQIDSKPLGKTERQLERALTFADVKREVKTTALWEEGLCVTAGEN